MTVSVHLPDELAARLAALATRRGITVDELTAQLLTGQLPAEHAGPHRLAFAGVGASTSGKTAVDADELLAEGFGQG